MNITLSTLNKRKAEGQKFSCLTAYDSTFANIVSSAGVEVILVGDSLGMVLQGKDSTVPVTMEEMIYHTTCVSRGNQGSLIMADMPFMSCATEEQTFENAAKLMRAGGHLVKVEGGSWFTGTISKLTERGIPVCVHLGLTPQSVNKFGGYKVQGRDDASRAALLQDSIDAEKAGAAILLYECIPSELMEEVMSNVSIPVIGIGAGPASDAQVLVLHDMLGATPGKVAKFVHNFMPDGDGTIQGAVAAYHQAVKDGNFPKPEHGFA
ncbi:3-methyl-2-oxobutanoate hydroxymethyltransferase [Gammaproteobacteria bacterium 45_16_T64]|nr:3-methyl-2-oxobutanoate hydroxymethyltransferase [Gammaproteobacteria bacterium 45_16_T64]